MIKEINIVETQVLTVFSLRYFSKLAEEIYHLISDIWLGAPVLQNWFDAILMSLFKGKGSKSICGDYRGIILLEVVNKMFTALSSQKVNDVLDQFVGQWTWIFLPVNSRINMHCIALYQVFVNLTKTFDTVNRIDLWTNLS